jgi:hypothetical protein
MVSIDQQMVTMSPQNQIKVLLKASELQLHSMGVLVREIPPLVVKEIQRFVNDDLEWEDMIATANTPVKQKRIIFAKESYAILQNVSEHMCRAPIMDGFAKTIIEGSYRTDTSILMGFGLRSITQTNNFQYRPNAIVAWGVADASDIVDFEDDTDVNVQLFLELKSEGSALNSWLRSGEVAEIDLACSAQNDNNNLWKTHGAGRALLTGTLAKIVNRTKNGQRKFKAVITYAAFEDGRSPPLKSALLAMGFTQIPSWFKYNGGTGKTNRVYFVLRDSNITWQRKVAKSVVWTSYMEKMCPLTREQGKTYCS